MELGLNGRTAFVTGASGGIGCAIAEAFAAEGSNVVCHAFRSGKRLREWLATRPWKDRAIDIQAGRIPPVFGAAGRRLYANDNVLIGYPLAWQYLTVLRTDAVPANADQLLGARSVGWRPWYSVGTPGYARGVPLTTAFRYDTGVEARFGHEQQPVSWAVALTAGTLSSPGARDSNGGPQVSTRLAVRPTAGLVLGASFADGRFLADDLEYPDTAATAPGYDYDAPVDGGRYHQQTWGADAEYSAGYFLVRAEFVTAGWRLPAVGTPAITERLRAAGLMARERPGLQFVLLAVCNLLSIYGVVPPRQNAPHRWKRSKSRWSP